MSEPSRAFVPGPQGKLHVDDGGQGGVPVLFLHGGAAGLEQWAAQLAHLRRTRRAAALDLRGHGASEPARDHDYSLESMVEDVLAVADGLGLPRFVLVSHSYGTGVAAAFASAHPSRLGGLFLVDGGYWLPTFEELGQLRQGFRPSRYLSLMEEWFEPLLVNARPQTRAEVLEAMRATPREIYVAATYGAMGFDPRPAIAAFGGPKYALGAQALDGPTMLHRAVPSLPFTLVGGVSHWIMLDAAEKLNDSLDHFLSAL